MKKLERRSPIFFMKGDHKNNQEMIGWLQILLKTVFPEIAPKIQRRGHRIFDHQIGGSQNIAEVLLEIHDPPIPKKMQESEHY